MKVAALFIYPLKSGPAIAVDGWEATMRGFAHDRRYMVTSPDGAFMTQRANPALGRAAAELTGDGVRFTAEGVGDLVIHQPQGDERTAVTVWSDRVAALRVSDAADDFFTTLLGEPAQLVYMPDDVHRGADQNPEHPLSFADGFPYLLATSASLGDLNLRITGDAVPMAAFRPNIVIDGAHAWAEDHWATLRIGEAEFTCATNCERCSITTLDPVRPDRPRRDGEPLRTLAKFRRNDRGKVDFARNALLSKAGSVRVGDPVVAGC